MAGDVKSALLNQYMQVLAAVLASPGELSKLGPAEVGALKQLLVQTQEVLSGSNATVGQNSNTNGGESAMATPPGNPEVLNAPGDGMETSS